MPKHARPIADTTKLENVDNGNYRKENKRAMEFTDKKRLIFQTNRVTLA